MIESKRVGGSLPSVGLALATISCAGLVPTTYPPFENVVRIEISWDSELGGEEENLVIDDPREIDAVMRFVNERSGGWSHPWHGVPVPFLVANFYQGRKFIGHFGVGANFFETQRDGDFSSRSAENHERFEFMNLLGVPERKIQALEANFGMGSW